MTDRHPDFQVISTSGTYGNADNWTFPFAPLEKYAWPGGYEIVAVTTDGDILCADCINDPTNPITSNMCGFPDWSDPGWNIEGIETSETYDEDEFCGHCNRRIGS